MRSRIIFWLVITVILVSFPTYTVPYILNKDSTYSGTLYLTQEQDYIRFKQELIDSKATWTNESIQVLSSAPPIIVKFSVQINKDYKFPFGSESRSTSLELILMVLLYLLVIILTNLIFCVIRNEDGTWAGSFWFIRK